MFSSVCLGLPSVVGPWKSPKKVFTSWNDKKNLEQSFFHAISVQQSLNCKVMGPDMNQILKIVGILIWEKSGNESVGIYNLF